MPALCHEDPAHGPVVRQTIFCEGCYRETLERVRVELLPAKERPAAAISKGKLAAKPAESTEDDARKLAEVIGRSVAAADGPVSRLDKRLAIDDAGRLARGVEVAKQLGYIELDNGRGFVPGPNKAPTAEAGKPKRKAASNVPAPVDLARIVWQETAERELVSSKRAAQLLGISTRTLSRLSPGAKSAGWIKTRVGAGYLRGDVEPPKPPENSTA